MPYAWAPDKSPTVTQYPNDHNLFWVAGKWGPRGYWEVSYPSQKVAYFEFYSRHSGRKALFYAYPDAKVPLAIFDGSVRTMRTDRTNPGYNPGTPASPSPTFFYYDPSILGFEPPTRNGAQAEAVIGWYRWTRGGLKGIDFGGREINTGQPIVP
ncbi:MAG: hypothetical protein JNM80_10800 [Phycisphaerae bacterium]|nr:hypothetical protein [Phycisphaerae bacterium]